MCSGAWSCRLKTRKVDVLPGPTTCCFWMLTLSNNGKRPSLLPLLAVHFRWHRFLLTFLGQEWKMFGCRVGIPLPQKNLNQVSCLPFLQRHPSASARLRASTTRQSNSTCPWKSPCWKKHEQLCRFCRGLHNDHIWSHHEGPGKSCWGNYKNISYSLLLSVTHGSALPKQ